MHEALKTQPLNDELLEEVLACAEEGLHLARRSHQLLQEETKRQAAEKQAASSLDVGEQAKTSEHETSAIELTLQFLVGKIKEIPEADRTHERLIACISQSYTTLGTNLFNDAKNKVDGPDVKDDQAKEALITYYRQQWTNLRIAIDSLVYPLNIGNQWSVKKRELDATLPSISSSAADAPIPLAAIGRSQGGNPGLSQGGNPGGRKTA